MYVYRMVAEKYKNLKIDLSCISENIPYTFATPDGKYKFLKKLGRGSDGEVYLACNRSLNNQIAIKIIKKNNNNNIDDYKNIYDKLMHPNILKPFDYQTDEIYIYMLMELFPFDLFDVIKNNRYKGISIDMIYKILNELLSAVKHCHDNGIYHYDIKPENILVDNNKNIKLIDFDNSFIRNNNNKRVTGTDLYLPPEFNNDEKIYNHASVDVWSIGVLLYVMIFLEFPTFNALGLLENPLIDIPIKIKLLLNGMLNYDSNQRFSIKECLEIMMIKN